MLIRQADGATITEEKLTATVRIEHNNKLKILCSFVNSAYTSLFIEVGIKCNCLDFFKH